jgi:hypothetical protein
VCTDLGSYDCLYLEEVPLYNWRRYVAITLQTDITPYKVLHHIKINKGYVIYRVLMAYSTTKLVILTYLKNCRLYLKQNQSIIRIQSMTKILMKDFRCTNSTVHISVIYI